jgi:hypothetical protein
MPSKHSLPLAGVLATLVIGGLNAGCSPPLGETSDPPSRPPPGTGPGPETMPPGTEPPPAGNGASIAGCPLFPPDNEWNRRIDGDQVDARSTSYITAMNGGVGTTFLHPDFGSDPTYGIPWIAVPGTQAKVPVTFQYADESDPGPYPIPPDAPVEGGAGAGGDRHVLVVDRDQCKLYETFDSHYRGPHWEAGSGAVWDLRSNALRPLGWTSADAAGLPVLSGLVRRQEVMAGRIAHALRFTVRRTQRAFVHPATHFASTLTDPNLPPLGLRVRLKASYDIGRFNRNVQVILTALKQYGMFLADNGGDWFISGEANPDWNDEELRQLKSVPASAFEAVRTGTLHR